MAGYVDQKGRYLSVILASDQNNITSRWRYFCWTVLRRGRVSPDRQDFIHSFGTINIVYT